MYVPTIAMRDYQTEEELRRDLEKAEAALRDFRARSNPMTRTPELWNLFYQLQAEAALLEDEFKRWQRGRAADKPKRKETRWEKVTRRKREEEEDE